MKTKDEIANLAATFVATVRRLQQQAGVNDSELSRAVNLDRGTLSRLLSGETTDPRLSTISSLAKFFAVPISALFGEDTYGFIPVFEQRALDDASQRGFAPRLGQYWIKADNAGASRFAVILDRKSRAVPISTNAILIIGQYDSIDLGDLIIYNIANNSTAIIKITQNSPLAGFDIESKSKNKTFPIDEHLVIGKVIEIRIPD
ncbi:helix-turn-helix domain-containing protein [Burkholderia glumae]|uniref:helix-turn-helix domain-containing protein n=1 Tax=Burkholderia glumae TaxID=337 RepID=UPI002151F846|nr:helix-turn-helix transcriptional regulator [Burkholderia glumae]